MSSNGAPSNGQYIPYLPPLRTGETVQQRFGGTLPVAVADAATLSFVLDPRGSTPCNSSFAVRHGKAAVATVGEIGDGTGVYWAAGDATRCNYRGPSYLSLQTTHAISGTSNVMMERLRIGPEGVITVPSNATLNVAGNVVFYGSAVFNGVTYFGGYGNLVDNHTSTSLIYPPTANALSAAYTSLSNLLVSSLSSFNYASSSNANNGCNGLYAPDLAYLEASASNAPYGWWIAQSGNDALITGPIACSTLFVAPGGCIVASSYCNLVTNYMVSDVTRPPTADALNAAYLQLSNQIYMQIQQAQLYGIVSFNQGTIPTWGGTATAFQSDLWLRSSDGIDRILFPSTSNSPVIFATGPSTSSASIAFSWNCNNGGGSNDGGSTVMSLAQNGTLALKGGILAGPITYSNATSGWAFAYDPLASNLSLSNASFVSTGSAAFAGGVSVGSNATVGGTFVAGTYCNLPYAGTWPSGTPGVVLLMADGVDPTLEGSNVAATASALKAASMQANERCDYLQGFLTEAISASVTASNASFFTSNVVFSEALDRAFSASTVVPGLTLTNNSTDSNAGVSILLGVGVGPSPQYLNSQMGIDPSFVPDPYGSNCASISVVTSTSTGLQELDLTGPTTVTYGSNGSVIVEPSCVVAIGKQVDVRQGPAGQASLPSDNPSGNTSMTWTDPSSGAVYAVSASSVLFPNSAWCAPYQGVSTTPPITPWISASGTYDSGTGNPTSSTATTTNINGGTQSIVGEWLEVDVTPGAFVNQFRVVAPVGLDYIPHDFVLLASTTPVSGPGGARWNIVSANITNQGPTLAASGSTGLSYSIVSSWTDTRFVAFRLVITQIYIATGFLPSGTVEANVQVDVFKLIGSIFAPLPNLLFTVNQNSLVVDRSGNVGIGTTSPSAPLHVTALDGLVAFAGSQGVPAVILLDAASGTLCCSNGYGSDFRGWSLSPDGLLQSVESYGAHHAFFAGSNELMRIGANGKVGIATSMPGATLDVAGTLSVRSNLTVLGGIVSPGFSATSNASYFSSNMAAMSSNPSFFGSNAAYTTSNALFGAVAFGGSGSGSASLVTIVGTLSVNGDLVVCGSVYSSNIAATSNTAYAALPAALYGSNLGLACTFASNVASVSSNPSYFGSNMAFSLSNPSLFGSNMAYALSNPSLITSNAYYSSSNSIFYGSNMAYSSSNASFITSNAYYSSSNSIFYGSNMAYASSNASFITSNAYYASSNSIFYGSNMAYASSNASFITSNAYYSSSNAIFYGSNMAYASSNASFITSNAYYSSSNSIFYGSNMAYASSNASFITSNAYYSSSNSIFYGSNMAYASSNASYITSNAYYASSNSIFYGSNMAYASSNASFVTSNAYYSSSNSIFYGSNMAYVSSNVSFITSNAYYSSSNSIFYGSNMAYASSNASFVTSNAYYSSSNSIFYGSNMAFASSNASFITSNAYYSSSNSIFYGSNMAYASSNASYYGSNFAYNSSNAIYWTSNSLSYTSNATYLGLSIAIFSSNVAISSSNPAFFSSNLSYSSSNASFITSNAYYSSSNAIFYGSNMAYASSNASYYGSNFAYNASNAIYWTSNSHFYTSNVAYALSNTFFFGNIASSYGSSNPAFFGSNAAYASSNPAFFGSNVAYTSSNAAFTGSNAAFASSNALFKSFLFSSSNTYSYVGIGTTVPSYPLHITVPTTTSATSIWVAGDIVSLSDRSVKTDVVPISGALEKLKSIGGYTYRRTDGDGPDQTRHTGVIAQEVEAVLKEAVHVDAITGYKSVAYGNLVALLIEAIKEMNETLGGRIERLENESFRPAAKRLS